MWNANLRPLMSPAASHKLHSHRQQQTPNSRARHCQASNNTASRTYKYIWLLIDQTCAQCRSLYCTRTPHTVHQPIKEIFQFKTNKIQKLVAACARGWRNRWQCTRVDALRHRYRHHFVHGNQQITRLPFQFHFVVIDIRNRMAIWTHCAELEIFIAAHNGREPTNLFPQISRQPTAIA